MIKDEAQLSKTESVIFDFKKLIIEPIIQSAVDDDN